MRRSERVALIEEPDQFTSERGVLGVLRGECELFGGAAYVHAVCGRQRDGRRVAAAEIGAAGEAAVEYDDHGRGTARQEVSVVGARTDEQHPDAEPGQRGHGCTPTPSGSPLVSSEEAAAEAFSALAASATASPSARSHTRFNSSDATPHAHNGFARRLKAQKAPARPPWGRGRGLRVPHAE